MIQNDVQFISFNNQDLEKAYNFYKIELYKVIDGVFGWDETFQKNRFQAQYKLDWFKWIVIESKHIGYICSFQKENEMHVSLLIISQEFQNRGYGKAVMEKFEQVARQQQARVTLSSFKENKGAVKFYKNMGYVIIDEDEYFLDLAKI